MKKRNEVSICKGDVCINASGSNANKITVAATFTLFCIGIGALLKVFR